MSLLCKFYLLCQHWHLLKKDRNRKRKNNREWPSIDDDNFRHRFLLCNQMGVCPCQSKYLYTPTKTNVPRQNYCQRATEEKQRSEGVKFREWVRYKGIHWNRLIQADFPKISAILQCHLTLIYNSWTALENRALPSTLTANGWEKRLQINYTQATTDKPSKCLKCQINMRHPGPQNQIWDVYIIWKLNK